MKKSNNRFLAIAALLVFAFLYFAGMGRFDLLPGDEGYFNIACSRMLHGELPYRDFFLHTPPYSYMAQAMVYRIFGSDFIVGRISMALLGVLVCLLLFRISSRLAVFPFSLIAPTLFIFWGVSHIPYPSFNWFALPIALFIFFPAHRFLKTGHRIHLFTAGVLTGVLCMTKQNYGGAALIAVFAFVFFMRFMFCGWTPRLFLCCRDLCKDVFFIASGTLSGALPAFIYFALKGAAGDMFFYLFRFSYESLRMRAELFPFPHVKPLSVVLAAVFLLGWYARRKGIRVIPRLAILSFIFAGAVFYSVSSLASINYFNDHFKEALINGYFNLPGAAIIAVLMIVGIKYFRHSPLERVDLFALFAAIFSLSYIWAGLVIARDMIHVIPTIPVAYPLFGYLGYYVYRRFKTDFRRDRGLVRYTFTFPMVFLCVVGICANVMNETFRSSSVPVYKMHYPAAVPKAEFILVDREKGQDIEALVDRIKELSSDGERIFLYYVDASIYIFSERAPASFNILFISDAFRERDQDRVIADLEANGVNLVVCDKEIYLKRMSGRTASEGPSRLEKFLMRSYKLDSVIGRFCVLRKNG